MFTPAHAPIFKTLAAIAALLIFILPARAIVVRGTVTTPLGIPIANARVQLIQGKRVAAFAYTQPDGTFEVRSATPGRFLLLTSASPFTPSISRDFYGGLTSVLTRAIVMEYATVTPQLSTLSTGIPTPVEQIPAPVTLIPLQSLTTEVNLLNQLRQSPGNEVVQTGQTGGPIVLYVRGGPADGNAVLIEGIPATGIGGGFDFSPISSTALDGPELYRGANSALYGTGPEASVVSLGTTHATSLRPVLLYTGDAGNFHTYRNEATLSGSHAKLDYLAAFSRFDTANALPLDEYHSTTTAANLGYALAPQHSRPLHRSQ